MEIITVCNLLVSFVLLSSGRALNFIIKKKNI